MFAVWLAEDRELNPNTRQLAACRLMLAWVAFKHLLHKQLIP